MPNKVLQTSFFNYGPRPFPKKLTIKQKFGQHTVASLLYDIRRPADYTLPPDGTPISIVWGTSPTGTKTFYGYNNHYETTVNQTGSAEVRLTVIGTSKGMNTTNPTNWFGYTRSGVAREIAKRHRLRSIIHPHDMIMENWATGIKSDFQVLQKLSDETGFRCWVDGPTLYFLDPQRLLLSAQRQDIPVIVGTNVRSAKITGGSAAPVSDGPITRKVAYGLDHRTNELFTVTNGELSSPDQILPITSNSYEEATNWVAAAQYGSKAFYTLDATVTGNASIVPGTLINFGNSRNVDDLGGYWSVQEAVHSLDRSDFTTRIQATRYQDKTPDILTTSTLRATPESVSMVVRDGFKWEATVQDHFNV